MECRPSGSDGSMWMCDGVILVGTTYSHHLHDRKWVAQLEVCLHLESEICPLQQAFIARVSVAFSLLIYVLRL